MGMREEYQSFMERQLTDWKAYIERLKSHTEQMNQQAKTNFDHQLELVRAKQTEAWEHLLKLKSASEDAWKHSQQQLDKAWNDMKSSADRITDFFGKK